MSTTEIGVTERDRHTHPARAGAAPLALGPEQRATLRRVVLSGLIGNFVEWYDLAAYAYAAVAISAAFFPDEARSVALLGTFAVYATTYVVRPFSGLVWGVLGDRFGRKKLLVLTIALMAASTTAIGVIPGYATIGIAAPLLLILARIVQGIAAGGEFIGAATYVYEHAPVHRRGLLVGLIQLGTGLTYPAAAFFSLGLNSWFGEQGYTSNGWRLMFLVSAPLGLVALFIRMKLSETPVFTELAARKRVSRSPLREAVTAHWRLLGSTALYICGYMVAAMMLNFYMPVYLPTVLGKSASATAVIMGFTMLTFALSIPCYGALVDRFPRSTMRLISCAVYLVLVIPAFLLIGRGATALLVIGLLLLATLEGFHYAIAPLSAIDVFPTEVRYTAGGIAYNIPVAVIPAVVPPLATLLVEGTGLVWSPALIGVGFSALAIVGALGISASHRRADRESGSAG